MTIAVSGSIATDHLMRFPGRFAESLVADKLEHVSLSFLVDDLVIRRGGVAGNIAYAIAQLGGKALLVGAVGADFADYRAALESVGVDCSGVKVSTKAHTARFMCTTDQDMAQIGSFYPGASAEATEVSIGSLGAVDLVLIGATDPAVMLAHTNECRSLGVPFAADPSQQLARLDGEQTRTLIDGAAYLFTNEYESHLTEQKTGWSAEEIAERVTTRVITRGADGVSVVTRGEEPVQVPVVPAASVADPTGVGDAFRAGFLTGLAHGLSHERCAQLGTALATECLETVGTQEYVLTGDEFLGRLAGVHGDEAAEELRSVISFPRP